VGVRRRPGISHIVVYRCESCRASETRVIGGSADGMCGRCGWPMRIDELFSDRRIVTVPVTKDRRVAVAS
jgi:hypothetical protein